MKLIELSKTLESEFELIKINNQYSTLQGKTIFITGATGLIGSYLISFLEYLNRTQKCNIKIVALSRSKKTAQLFFDGFPNVEVIEGDIVNKVNYADKIDYIIHGASNTHPIDYSTKPIETIMTNILGTRNILDFSIVKAVKRVIFLSSVEIYGENKGDVVLFDESYLGAIDCNTLRAGYPESKRLAESLFSAFHKEYSLDYVVLRLSRVFGPTMRINDSKVLSQFIKNAAEKKDIVLKSKGNQLYSYIYVGDAVSSIIKVLFDGNNTEAYNVAIPDFDLSLYDIAKLISRKYELNVIFEEASQIERAGYSKATKAQMNVKKLNSIGWKSIFAFDTYIFRTIDSIRESFFQTDFDTL